MTAQAISNITIWVMFFYLAIGFLMPKERAWLPLKVLTYFLSVIFSIVNVGLAALIAQDNIGTVGLDALETSLDVMLISVILIAFFSMMWLAVLFFKSAGTETMEMLEGAADDLNRGSR